MIKSFAWYLLRFFTTWSTVFMLLHRYTSNIFNLVYMTWIVLVIGLYFSFINPRKFVVYGNDGKKIAFNGIQKFFMIDLVFHILMFYYAWYLYGAKKQHSATYLNVILIMLIYFSLVDVKLVYGVDMYEIILVYCFANIVFFFVINK